MHATVRAHFVDAATQRPITKARLAIGSVRTFFHLGQADLDAEGRAVFRGVQPGIQMLYADVPDHEELHRMIEVAPGADLDLGTIALSSPHAIEGVLSDIDGHPIIADLWCRKLADLTFPQMLDIDWRISTDERGQFRIGDRSSPSLTGFSAPVGPLGTGTYLIYPETGPHSSWAINPVAVTIGEKDTESVTMQLAPGYTVTIHASGELAIGLYLVTVAMDNVPVWSAIAFDETPKSLRLRSGQYELTVTRARSIVDRRTFTVAERDVAIEWTQSH
jgi:hypothetical protein